MNPKGRTGLRGRGVLPFWGPNYVITVVITRYINSSVLRRRHHLAKRRHYQFYFFVTVIIDYYCQTYPPPHHLSCRCRRQSSTLATLGDGYCVARSVFQNVRFSEGRYTKTDYPLWYILDPIVRSSLTTKLCHKIISVTLLLHCIYIIGTSTVRVQIAVEFWLV